MKHDTGLVAEMEENSKVVRRLIIAVPIGLAFLVVIAGAGYTADELRDMHKDQCSLCPDNEEEMCEEDKWELGYILHHCPSDPELYICIDAPKLKAAEQSLEMCIRRGNMYRRQVGRLKDHVQLLKDICRKDKQ